MPHSESAPQFLLCIRNDGYPTSLELRKVYRALHDPSAESKGFVRVIDESGEDYLFPSGYFEPVEFPGADSGVSRTRSGRKSDRPLPM